MKGKKSFILYVDYRQHLEILTEQERGQLLMALFDYAEGIEPEDLAGAARMAFSFIRAQIDRDTEKWEAVRQAKAEAGKLGGLKSGETRRNRAELSTGEHDEANQAEPSRGKQRQANEAYASCASDIEAEASRGKQRQANEAVTVTVTANVTDNVTDNATDNVMELPSLSEGSDTERETRVENAQQSTEGKRSDPVPYKKIQELYNEICQSYPKVIKLNDQRKRSIGARWREAPSIKTFEGLFIKAEASSFMKGNSSRGWRASFDWMMNPSNFIKILEGNYDDRDINIKAETTQPQHEAPQLSGFHIAGDD